MPLTEIQGVPKRRSTPGPIKEASSSDSDDDISKEIEADIVRHDKLIAIKDLKWNFIAPGAFDHRDDSKSYQSSNPELANSDI